MPTRKSQIYRCSDCGNVVEVIRPASGRLVCCDIPMELLTETTADAAREKHVPVIEQVEGGVRVSIGSVAHPMLDNHYIEWIELTADGESHRRFLKPDGEPAAFFAVQCQKVTARALCNLHGLWRADQE